MHWGQTQWRQINLSWTCRGNHEFGLSFCNGGWKESNRRFRCMMLRPCGHWVFPLLSKVSKRGHAFREPSMQWITCGDTFSKLWEHIKPCVGRGVSILRPLRLVVHRLYILGERSTPSRLRSSPLVRPRQPTGKWKNWLIFFRGVGEKPPSRKHVSFDPLPSCMGLFHFQLLEFAWDLFEWSNPLKSRQCTSIQKGANFELPKTMFLQLLDPDCFIQWYHIYEEWLKSMNKNRYISIYIYIHIYLYIYITYIFF